MEAASGRLPIEVKQAIIWSVPRSGSRFVVALPSPVPKSVGLVLVSSGCVALRSKLIDEGVAFLIRVPPAIAPQFSRLPSGGRGSFHPSSYLGF